MLTEQDFEKAEAAVKTISCWHNCVLYFNTEVCMAEKTLYEFTKKVLAEARRDFLTETKTVDMGVLENGRMK